MRSIFLDFANGGCYIISAGGDEIYKIIFIIFSIFISYYLISQHFISAKRKHIFKDFYQRGEDEKNH